MSTETKIMAILEGDGASCCMDSAEDRRLLCDLLLVGQPWLGDPVNVVKVIKESHVAVIKAHLENKDIDIATAAVIMGLLDELARNAAMLVINL